VQRSRSFPLRRACAATALTNGCGWQHARIGEREAAGTPKRAIGKGISTRGVGGLEQAAIEVRVSKEDMKRRSPLATSLAALRKAEAHLQALRVRASTERARLLEDLHVRLGFASRERLIEALVAIDGEHLPKRRSFTNDSAPSDVPHLEKPSRTTRRGKPSDRSNAGAIAGGAPDRSNRSLEALQNLGKAPLPVRSIKRISMGPTPRASDAESSKAAMDVAASIVVDLPIAVRRLLDSASSPEPRWAVPEERHAIVVEILTRGNDAAERWLWSQTSKEDARTLLRRYGGAGFDDEARDVLRRKMGLSERDVPRRPFRAMAPRKLVSS
jgi:hypothetical protein